VSRRFCCKFCGNTVPSITFIHKVINKVRFAGSCMDKKHAKMCIVLTEEKLDKIVARLEHTSEIY
jgi:hypothetical protein